MMKVDTGIIKSNTYIGKDVYKMEIQTDLADKVKCGQFVEVEVPSYFLRRPISVCEVKEDHTIVLVYKVVGDGTRFMTTMHDEISLFGPCGNGFPVEDEDVLLIGGGVGVPPLLQTAKEYKKIGKNVSVVVGFNTKEDAILIDELKEYSDALYIATMDGSEGTKGTVIDAINENNVDCEYVLSCGPLPMLKAVNTKYTKGCISLEARMACGIGACMGCVVKDSDGNSLRVCKDGPVFPIGKVVL